MARRPPTCVMVCLSVCCGCLQLLMRSDITRRLQLELTLEDLVLAHGQTLRDALAQCKPVKAGERPTLCYRLKPQ